MATTPDHDLGGPRKIRLSRRGSTTCLSILIHVSFDLIYIPIALDAEILKKNPQDDRRVRRLQWSSA